MTDLLAIIQNGNGNIKLEINDEDMAAMQTLAYDSLRKNPEKVEDSSYNSVLYNLKSATTRLYDTEAKIICIVSKKGAQ
ncbi:hypothetical protein, partial [Bacteroides fragilis]|uniref:hypothetical protein n=2 Tax=Bacteroides fragilis TaxID=817 RepID=UPI0032EF3546